MASKYAELESKFTELQKKYDNLLLVRGEIAESNEEITDEVEVDEEIEVEEVGAVSE